MELLENEAERIRALIDGASTLLAQKGVLLPVDARHAQLQQVKQAGRYKGFVSITSTCRQVTNAEAWLCPQGCHHQVRINANLNRQLTQEEALALIAHEVSHLKRCHGQRYRKALRRTRRVISRTVTWVHRWGSPVWARALQRRLQPWPRRVSEWLSVKYEYQADADAIGWLGPRYALPMASMLHKATRLPGKSQVRLRRGWRTHPSLVQRYRALGITPSQVQSYIRQQRLARKQAA